MVGACPRRRLVRGKRSCDRETSAEAKGCGRSRESASGAQRHNGDRRPDRLGLGARQLDFLNASLFDRRR